ncbi:uncharacterized protein LOC144449511 [Glandiceps talaboti]
MCSTRGWYLLTAITLVIALILFIVAVIITAVCSASNPVKECISPSEKTTLTTSYDITSTLGISMEIVMIFCTLRLYSLSHSVNFTSEIRVLSAWFTIMRSQSWARNRLCLLLIVMCYLLMLVTMSVRADDHVAAIKNAVITLQAVFLYFLLLVSNLHGPIGRFHPTRGVHPPSRHVTCLSFILFTFAAIIDLLHFARITLVETVAEWGNDDDDDDNDSFSIIGILGLTSHIALRLDFAQYFWEMAFVGFSKKLRIYGGENTVLRDIAADWIEADTNSQNADTRENNPTVIEPDSHIEDAPLLQRNQEGKSVTYGSGETPSTAAF